MNACAICGRTILAGERVRGYVDGGEERGVCELCVARADQLGWRAADAPGTERSQDKGHEGRGRLRGLLHRRPRRPGGSVPGTTPDPQPEGREGEGAEEDPQAPQPDPAAATRRPRPVAQPGPEAPTPFERAVARFNSSEAGRTVTGLTRTLGTPWVSVGASAGAADEVRITVAWELSWYQWGVDIGDELRPVFQLDKGREIDQLDHPARQWNATVAEDGRLRLTSEAAAGR